MLIPNKHSGYVIDGRRLYLGGKGGDVPAPDPRLVDAQIRAMGFQEDAINRVLATSESMAPLQREQLQFGLSTGRTAYEQSQADRAWTLGRRDELASAQNRLLQEAASYNTEARRAELAGQAVADVTQGFQAARGTAERNLARMGLNPASGAFAAMQSGSVADEALARAGAATNARRAAVAEGRGLTAQAAQMLAGYPAMGMSASGAGAGFGAAGLSLANTGLAGLNSGYSQAGGLSGQMGQGASQMYGVQAQAYGQAQGQQGEFMGSILGAGTTIGAAAIMA